MRESLERNGCLTGVIAVCIAFVVTTGMISFIVWSPCREDWPSDGNSTTELLSTTTEEIISTLSSNTPTPRSSPTTSTLTQSSSVSTSPTTSALTQSSSVSTSILSSSSTDSFEYVYASVPKSPLTSPGLESNDETIKNENYVPRMAASSVLKKGAKDLESGRAESPLRPLAPPYYQATLLIMGVPYSRYSKYYRKDYKIFAATRETVEKMSDNYNEDQFYFESHHPGDDERILGLPVNSLQKKIKEQEQVDLGPLYRLQEENGLW